MGKEETRSLRRFTDKLYGGLNMSWMAVILFAVATAVLTAVFLIVPIFKNTSFERMGVTLEAWIFFAVIIMANCKKPLESALKTFVFFLLSQPLIYLLQVPFSSLGWGIFGFYRYWFIWTLLTFPMAFVGWYIGRKNWLSLLILMPALCLLTSDYVGAFRETIAHFPHLLITALFCLGQVLIYLYAFTSDKWQKLVGFLVPLAIVIVMLLVTPRVDIGMIDTLPDEPSFSSQATVTVEDASVADVSLTIPEEGRVQINAHKYGTTAVTIKDGDQEMRYSIEVYKDDGVGRISITPTN